MSIFIMILKSADGEIFISSTRNPVLCWQKHNEGYYSITKYCRPWDLIYVEKLERKSDVLCRKKRLTDWANYNLGECLRQEENIVQEILISERHHLMKKPVHVVSVYMK